MLQVELAGEGLQAPSTSLRGVLQVKRPGVNEGVCPWRLGHRAIACEDPAPVRCSAVSNRGRFDTGRSCGTLCGRGTTACARGKLLARGGSPGTKLCTVLHGAPGRGLHKVPGRGLHKAPGRGLYNSPCKGLHEPGIGLHDPGGMGLPEPGIGLLEPGRFNIGLQEPGRGLHEPGDGSIGLTGPGMGLHQPGCGKGLHEPGIGLLGPFKHVVDAGLTVKATVAGELCCRTGDLTGDLKRASLGDCKPLGVGE